MSLNSYIWKLYCESSDGQRMLKMPLLELAKSRGCDPTQSSINAIEVDGDKVVDLVSLELDFNLDIEDLFGNNEPTSIDEANKLFLDYIADAGFYEVESEGRKFLAQQGVDENGDPDYLFFVGNVEEISVALPTAFRNTSFPISLLVSSISLSPSAGRTKSRCPNCRASCNTGRGQSFTLRSISPFTNGDSVLA